MIDTTNQTIDAAQAHLDFDPSLLQVVDSDGNATDSITPGSIFDEDWDDILQNSVDNQIGQISFAGGRGFQGQAASGSLVTLASIRLKATALIPPGGTEITFSATIPRATKATSGLSNVTGTLTGATFTSQAGPIDAPFSLTPVESQLASGETVTLSIEFDATNQSVDAAQAYLDFDPALLQVVDSDGNATDSITPGSIFDEDWNDILQNSVDNQAGQISFAGGRGIQGKIASSSPITLATVRLKAIAQIPLGGTQITFSTTIPRATKATSGLSDVTGTLTGAAIAPGSASADLSVTKSVDDSSPQEGDTITFTVTVANNGPDAATGVVVTDAIPSGLTLQSATSSDGAYSTGTGNWTLTSLSNGASSTLTLVTTVDSGTASSTITNTATVTASDQADPVSGNDSDSAVVNVSALPVSARCRYDANSSGTIERAEAITAVTEYLLQLGNPSPTRSEAVDVVTAFLLSQSFICP